MLEKSVWKTLPVCNANSMNELMAILKEDGFVLGWNAGMVCKAVAGSFLLPRKPVRIAILSREKLGLPINATEREFFQKAEELGYGLCSVEVGLLARLAYGHEEQLNNYRANLWRIYIAMQPVEVEDGKSLILRISCGTMGSRLDAVECRMDEEWDPKEKNRRDLEWIEKNDKWIFVIKEEVK